MKTDTKTSHNQSSITDFKCKIPKYQNSKPLAEKDENNSKKLGIVQAIL